MLSRRSFLSSALVGGASIALRQSSARPVHRSRSRTLAQAIRGQVIVRGAPGFAAAAHVYNERFDNVLPVSIARPVDGVDVQAALRWLVPGAVPSRARSGGHSYAGYSTFEDGVVLDLRELRQITVDHTAATATVGAGAQLIDVYSALAAHGATIPAGSCPSVGVGGHALGGGMGLAGRHLGLAADSLVAAQIATADGRLRTINARTDPDLLWALRGGGGGNFGVVTELTFALHAMPASAAYFGVNWPWSSASDALEAWLGWAPRATSLVTSVLHLTAGAGATAVSVSGQYFGPEAGLASLLEPLRAVPGASVDTGAESYPDLMLRWAGCLSVPLADCHTSGDDPGGTLQRASFDAKSDYLARALPSAGRMALIEAIERRAGHPGSGAILFDSYGGVINAVSPEATAFVHRDQLACMQYLTYGGDTDWLSETYVAMRPYVSGYAYQNYIDAAQPSWQHAYYGANYARLQAVRRAVDPLRYFTFEQAID